MSDTILEMRSISKTFPGVQALRDVSLKVAEHEIHAIVGENGAGKSTLMKILSGVYPHDSYEGSILFNKNECLFKNISDSERLGIVIIHQELALIPKLSIAENIFLGNERAKFSVIDWNRTHRHAHELLKRVGLEENPETRIESLGIGKQQLVEIAKALSKKVSLLILDEPTAALNDEESDKLLQLLLELKRHGVTSILISHKLNEIARVADTITVIRDGQVIETIPNAGHRVDQARIIKSMVGRELTARFPARTGTPGEVIFAVENWSVHDPFIEKKIALNNISLTVRKGEVVGFAGLMGSGRTELAMSLFGRSYGKHHRGTILKNGKEIRPRNVPAAIKQGIAYATEDRKAYGLVLISDIRRNITLPNLPGLSRALVINENREILAARDFRDKLRIRSSGIDQVVGNLSGGNQQKVVLSKWIMAQPDILILDEPTRGIDVGAKYEIYLLINQLAEQGKAIVLISSEMPELLGMCDRIYVVSDGEIAGELPKEIAAQESIMKCIMDHQAREKSRSAV